MLSNTDTQNKQKILVFASGSGTTFRHLYQLSRDPEIEDYFPFEIVALISNQPNSQVVKEAQAKYLYFPVIVQERLPNEKRLDYDQRMIKKLEEEAIIDLQNIDLIFLAGYMRIITPEFIKYFNQKGIEIINLHPSLPGEYPGINSVEKAHQDYLDGKITQTGSMIHYVDEGVDTGETIETCLTEMDESLEKTQENIKNNEKYLVIRGLFRWLLNKKIVEKEIRENHEKHYRICYSYKYLGRGKVRDLYHLIMHPITRRTTPKFLLLDHSDRLSSFDRQITTINRRGILLNIISSRIMEMLSQKTSVPLAYINHLSEERIQWMEVCRPIPLEVVVRAYITGNTSTSLWTHYQKAKNNNQESNEIEYCGLKFPPNLVKNQVLPNLVITPTTKGLDGDHDRPISETEILEEGILKEDEWNQIKEYALEIFKFGQEMSKKMGLILVDTKFEFGYNSDGKIVLIDEALTPDSSRYWYQSTYFMRFTSGLEPDKLGKDMIRDYVKHNTGDPYNQPIPEIPFSLKEKVYDSYREFGLKLYQNQSQNPIDDTPKILNQKYQEYQKTKEEGNQNNEYPSLDVYNNFNSYQKEVINCYRTNQLLELTSVDGF